MSFLRSRSVLRQLSADSMTIYYNCDKQRDNIRTNLYFLGSIYLMFAKSSPVFHKNNQEFKMTII